MGQTGSRAFEGKVVRTLTGHSRAVLHCEFSQDGELEFVEISFVGELTRKGNHEV